MMSYFKKNKTIFFLLSVVCALVFLSGCGQKIYEPVAINPAVDTCGQCKMAVEDGAFAAQLFLGDGTSMKFDDIGCMVDYLIDAGSKQKIADRYVRDLNTNEWVRLEAATFVTNTGVGSPMNYDIVAFKDKAQAEQFSKEKNLQDALLTGEQILQAKPERKKPSH